MRVTARMERQREFSKRGSQLLAVITEAVLHCVVGGPETLREQLAQLVVASEAPNVTIQAIPYTVCAHPSMTASFGIVDPRADAIMQPIVYSELPVGHFYLDDADGLTTFREIFANLQNIALPPDESRQLIAGAIRGR